MGTFYNVCLIPKCRGNIDLIGLCVVREHPVGSSINAERGKSSTGQYPGFRGTSYSVFIDQTHSQFSVHCFYQLMIDPAFNLTHYRMFTLTVKITKPTIELWTVVTMLILYIYYQKCMAEPDVRPPDASNPSAKSISGRRNSSRSNGRSHEKVQ